MGTVSDQRTPAKPRAVAYYRHSAQDRQNDSIAVQRNQVRRWAERNGVEIVREFTDDGHCGLADDERPAFNEMIDELANGQDDVDYILCADASRCSRSARHAAACQQSGKQIIDTSMGRLGEGGVCGQ